MMRLSSAAISSPNRVMAGSRLGTRTLIRLVGSVLSCSGLDHHYIHLTMVVAGRDWRRRWILAMPKASNLNSSSSVFEARDVLNASRRAFISAMSILFATFRLCYRM
jgi:hypothetical protein